MSFCDETEVDYLRAIEGLTGYGLALDLQRIAKSGLLARLSGAERVLGFDRARSKELGWLWATEHLAPNPGSRHMVEWYLEFVHRLGLPYREPLHRLPADPAAAAWAEEQLAQYLVYRPGRAGGGQMRLLRDETGVRIIGSPIADAVQRAADAVFEQLLADYVEERRLLPLMVRAGAKQGIIVKIGDREVPFSV